MQFVLHFVLSLQLVMRHNCLKPASTQLRGRVQLNGARMTSCNVHDTATALTSAVVECTAAAILGRPVCRCELHCIAFALCACLAREGIAPRPRCGGGLAGLGGGEGLGVTAQQFKDDWCQLLVGLSTGGKGRQTKTNMEGMGGGGSRVLNL